METIKRKREEWQKEKAFQKKNLKALGEQIQKLYFLSNKYKEDKKEKKIKKINELLKIWYKYQKGGESLRTYNDWKIKGYQVRKGQKGLPVWSKPQKGVNSDGSEYVFYNIKYLFCNTQVYKIKV